jgi:hypothetical protein
MRRAHLVESMDPAVMTEYARICGWTLAKAHARSGDAIARLLPRSARSGNAIARFAEAYADQNERDYDALKSSRHRPRRGENNL